MQIYGTKTMLKKVTIIFLMAIFAFLTPMNAFATGSYPWQILLDDGYPAVIDRYNNPKAYPEFSFPEDKQLLEIWPVNVWLADAFFLCYGDQCWMIDCADSSCVDRVTTLMKKLDITRIDRIINSHPHHDHLNGLAAVAGMAEVGELAVGFPEDCTEHMIQAMETCREKNITVTHFEDGTRLMMGDVSLDIMMKCDESYKMNDRSAVIRVQYGERTALFTGDIENDGQQKLAETVDHALLKADVLKYPHHGRVKMDESFYKAVNPSLVLVTNNTESGDAPSYLRNKRVPSAFCVNPYVHLATDGVHWLVERIPDPGACPQ